MLSSGAPCLLRRPSSSAMSDRLSPPVLRTAMRACLHRLRHTVATVLVADGKLLQAQRRLGHAEASTTLRQYCHALPLHDQDVADQLNACSNTRHRRRRRNGTAAGRPSAVEDVCPHLSIATASGSGDTASRARRSPRPRRRSGAG